VNGTAIFVSANLTGTAFYVLGSCLAVLALAVTAIGLRDSQAFSSSMAAKVGLVVFGVLVIGTATYAVLYSEEEQEHREAELAAEEAEEGAEAIPGGGEVPAPDAPALGAAPAAEGGETKAEETVKGPGGTLQLAAEPTAIAYDKKALSSKPGQVTIDLQNPSQISHDVAIAKGNQELAKSDLVAGGETSATAGLAPGEYVFYCTVPGHREAGMEGTLTVK
jgi:plastocyanin